VANAEKILTRMRVNPRDWRIEDLKVLAAHYSIEHRQPGSSHIKRFVALIDKLEDEE